ncbi:EAL domain-containing protein [bacterium]|nr:EAL domain-containing protein [bacterium]
MEGIDKALAPFFELIFLAYPDPLFVVSVEGGDYHYRAVNDAYLRHAGLSLEEVLSRRVVDVLPPAARPYLLGKFAEALKAKRSIVYEVSAPEGRTFEAVISPIVTPEGDCPYLLGSLMDITPRKRAEAELEFARFHDGVTGLPNRFSLRQRLAEALIHAESLDQSVMLLVLDLDRFKPLNETLGHPMADRLLCQVAVRLQAALPLGGTVARLDGDEFGVLAFGDAQDAEALAQRLQEVFSLPFMVDGHEVYLTASIGVGRFPADAQNPDALMRCAGVALDRAKQERNAYCLYHLGLSEDTTDRLVLGHKLRHALERHELTVHYQPQVCLESGRIFGAEALIRWHHPQLGMISPAKFIPLAEECGLIVPITEWVMRAACLQQRCWAQEGLGDVRMSVNLSGRHFKRQNLAELVKRVLAETSIPPTCLDLELTESILMDNVEASAEVMQELSRIGILFSVDDFGTGYSSLSYLQRFPLHTLKVDQSFVRGITSGEDGAPITSAIIAMAHSLGMKVIAEGVETRAQLDFLRERRCDGYQGYYFSRPVPAEEFGALLRAAHKV